MPPRSPPRTTPPTATLPVVLAPAPWRHRPSRRAAPVGRGLFTTPSVWFSVSPVQAYAAGSGQPAPFGAPFFSILFGGTPRLAGQPHHANAKLTAP